MYSVGRADTGSAGAHVPSTYARTLAPSASLQTHFTSGIPTNTSIASRRALA